MSRKRSKRWVYLIGSPDVRTVKIGVSDEPEARLEDLQTGSPVRLLLLWKTPGGQGLESALHAYFAPYRVHGEWFDFGEENAAALVATAAVLLGHRAQPERVSGELRYRRSDCTSCAGARVCEAVAVPLEVRPLPVVPAQAQAPDPVVRSTNVWRVLDAVKAMPLPVRQKDIVGVVGLSKGTVSKAVKRLVEVGFLVRDEDGAVTIPTAEEARV